MGAFFPPKKAVRELSGTTAFLRRESKRNKKHLGLHAHWLGEGFANESLPEKAACLKDDWNHGSVVSTTAVCGLLQNTSSLCLGFFSSSHDAYKCFN